MLAWPQKRILWAFEKGILQFFASFSVTKLKSLSGKVQQSVQTYLNQDLVTERFLGNSFEATLRSRTNVVSVWKGRFSKSVKNYFNQNFVIARFLENGFKASLGSKRNVLSLWIVHFTAFCRFMRDQVETTFRESEATRSKLFKSKFAQTKFLR